MGNEQIDGSQFVDKNVSVVVGGERINIQPLLAKTSQLLNLGTILTLEQIDHSTPEAENEALAVEILAVCTLDALYISDITQIAILTQVQTTPSLYGHNHLVFSWLSEKNTGYLVFIDKHGMASPEDGISGISYEDSKKIEDWRARGPFANFDLFMGSFSKINPHDLKNLIVALEHASFNESETESAATKYITNYSRPHARVRLGHDNPEIVLPISIETDGKFFA